jgi:hypothetical protein
MADSRLPESVQAGHADHVMTPDEQLTIRPSAGGAVLMVAWILFLCLLMVVGALNQHDPRGLLLVLIWLPWLVPVALIGRYRLSVAGDVLTYRSPRRTRHWRRDQIAEFGIVQSTLNPRIGYVYMRTHNGEQVTFHIAAGSRRRPERLQGWLVALRDWLPAAHPPGSY